MLDILDCGYQLDNIKYDVFWCVNFLKTHIVMFDVTEYIVWYNVTDIIYIILN